MRVAPHGAECQADHEGILNRLSLLAFIGIEIKRVDPDSDTDTERLLSFILGDLSSSVRSSLPAAKKHPFRRRRTQVFSILRIS